MCSPSGSGWMDELWVLGRGAPGCSTPPCAIPLHPTPASAAPPPITDELSRWMSEAQWAAVDALASSGLPGFASLSKVGRAAGVPLLPTASGPGHDWQRGAQPIGIKLLSAKRTS